MPTKGLRAWIGDDEELQICRYTLEFRDMRRTKLAEKIRAEVHWPGKRPEIEVLERKISHYRKHAVDHPEDKPWSMASLDRYPISPQAIPPVLACWKNAVQSGTILTIREAKWASRLYALMADEVHQSFIWHHGAKWLELDTSCNNAIVKKSSARQSSRRNKETASEFSLRAEEGDHGAIECPKCRTPIGIGPTTRTAICLGCEGQFDIVRIPAGTEDPGTLRKETSVVKTIPPIIEGVSSLTYCAKGYANLELIYDLIGQPFDSTCMDRRIMGLGRLIPDLNDEASLLPYLAMAIQDFKDFRDKVRRLTNERSHKKKR